MKNHCIDCGILLKGHGNPLRCRSHAQKLNKTGIRHSVSHKRKIGEANKGKHNHPHTEETKQKISLKLKGRTSPMKGKHHTEETKKKLSIATTNNNPMKNPETVRKVLRRREITSLEQKLLDLINKHSLSYKFVGNGTFMVGKKNPDFVHLSQHTVIEIYCIYFKLKHYDSIEEYETKRVAYFKKYGYKTILIRDYMMNNEQNILSLLGGDSN